MSEEISLEERAIRYAQHLTEYYDPEDLGIFVKWSIQKHYHPYQAMVYLYEATKQDREWDEMILFPIRDYMRDVENRFYAVKMRKEEIDKENNQD